ncbi:MAG: glycosyltransferase family 4 protein [bacterium]
MTNAVPDVSIEGDPRAGGSLGIINRQLLAALDRAGEIRTAADAESAAVHVRHRWPPDWTPPRNGVWVLMQPWEFGTVPQSWVGPIQAYVDEVWVPSEYVRRGYLASGIPPARVRVVPYGVDTTLFRPDAAPWPALTEKPVRFLAVGGTIPRKGTDVLLAAYLEAFTRDDPVCLIIKDQGVGTYYGGQTLGETIARARRDPAAPEIVHLTDETPHADLPGLYASCTCLVQSYRGEGFALPVAEAMASGRPVVVTDGGPTDEFVPDDAGWRIPSAAATRIAQVGDLPLAGPGWVLEPDRAALAAILREVAASPRACEEKGRRAREAAGRVTWDRMASIAAANVRRLAGLPPRRATRGILGPNPAPVAYLACPEWSKPQTVQTALSHYLDDAQPGYPSALYLWAPHALLQSRCREQVAVALHGRRVPPAKRLMMLSHADPAAQDAILSAVDGLIPSGGRAERTWIARARELGR